MTIQHPTDFKSSQNEKQKFQTCDFSVVIPTADRGPLLQRAVESVLNQTLAPAKVVVVDNGRDEVKIQFDDPRVEILRTAPRIGPGRSRNIGARHCDTEYVAFLDDDDRWEPEYLEFTLKKFEETNADVVVGKLKRQGLDGRLQDYKMFPEDPARQRSVFYKNEGFGGQNITLKRDVFLEVGGFDERMPASVDRDLAARLIVSGKKIVCEPKAVAVLCDHGGGRVRAKQLKGNRMLICKHWRQMRLVELFKALKTYLIRIILYTTKRATP
jgi:glycosyltransferase involved in cell wall biosynthesis